MVPQEYQTTKLELVCFCPGAAALHQEGFSNYGATYFEGSADSVEVVEVPPGALISSMEDEGEEPDAAAIYDSDGTGVATGTNVRRWRCMAGGPQLTSNLMFSV